MRYVIKTKHHGKITGTDFSFNISVNGTDVKHTGRYADADTAGLDIDYNGMKFHTTLSVTHSKNNPDDSYKTQPGGRVLFC